MSTNPWGALGLSVVAAEVMFPTRNIWDLPVREFRIQLQREMFRPNFHISFWEMIVLNTELKSISSILTWVLETDQQSVMI